MSKILDRIEQLKRQQKKVDFLLHILDSAKNYNDKDFKDVHEEVVEKLTVFVENSIKNIEDGSELDSNSSSGLNLTEEQKNNLLLILDKVSKGKTIQAPANQKKLSNPVKNNHLDKQDKLAFAMDNRHLANKKVVATNISGDKVNGTVVGLDAPYVVVRTDSGVTVQVELEQIELRG